MDVDPILVLSPHPDDAVLGCWSALDQRDRPVRVVNVFAGIPAAGTSGGWDRECGVSDSPEMMRRRRAEDARALGLIDLVPTNLDFLDSQYTEEKRDPAAIAAIVRALAPRCSALYAPAATGGVTPLLGMPGVTLDPHPDHEALREVALRLRRTGVPTYLYAEIPYATGPRGGESWPRSARAFTALLDVALAQRLEFVVHKHSEESLARRVAVIAQYGTQLTRVQEGVGHFATNSAILSYDVCWRL